MKYKSKNNYPDTSGFKALLKDTICYSRYIYWSIINFGKVKTILCYPEFPAWYSNFYALLSYSKFNVTSCTNKKFDYVISWKDTTFREVDETLSSLAEKFKVININCNDISKEKVEECFSKVFGYDSFIDPFTYQGKAVEKQNLNGRHEQASIIDCPVPTTKPGFVYQKLFKTSGDDSVFVDLRLSIVDDQIPIVYKRYKGINNRFHVIETYEQLSADQLFSNDEIQKIIKVCQLIGLEFGEIDCVRHTEDNLLYIIDVNNTPHQPPKGVRTRKYIKHEHETMKNHFINLLNKMYTEKQA